MNKSKRFLVGIIALSAVLLFSCNNFAGGKVAEKETAPVSSEKTLLTVSIDEMLTSAQKPAASRNIMPTTWTSEKANGLSFVLTGTKTAGGATNEVPTSNGVNVFTYAQLMSGEASILLDSTTWYLTLTAYTEIEHTNVALVSSQETVNLSGGAPSDILYFTMKVPTESTNAVGSAAITVEFIQPSNLTKIVYGLYEAGLPTSAAVADTVVTDAAVTVNDMTTLTAVNAGINKYKVQYLKSSVKAGKYYFNAIFYGNGDQIICFYSDTIQIDGGNDTTKTITLSDNAFNKPAAKPTTLTVAYSYNDSANNAYAAMKPAELASGNSADDNFYATFTWNDVSDNETGFELVVTDTANPTTPVTYTAASAVTDGVVKGNLSASSTSATIKLDTGKVYTAKIRAVNGFTPANSVATELSENVNLFTISYNWGNDGDPTKLGKIKTSNTTETDDTTVTYAVPLTSTTGYSLIGSDTAVFPYISRTDYVFIKWYVNDTTEPAYTIPAGNTANIELFAYWQSRLGVGIIMPDYSSIADYALVNSYSEAAVYSISGIQSGDTPVKVELTPNTGLTDVTWTVYDTDFTTVISDNIVIDDTDPATATYALTWTINDTANSVLVPSGTYRIAVAGTLNGENETGNIYIKITR